MYARIGLIRSTMEQRVLAETAQLLATELRENALLKTDPELRIFTLQVKGDIDFEIDASIARQDWEELSIWRSRPTITNGVAERGANSDWLHSLKDTSLSQESLSETL